VCTVLLLLRPGETWPLIAGANRDERIDRAFLPPGRHWPDAPHVVAGYDRAGGGSWFGASDDGVFATIVNGMDRLGPQPGKASRGELVLRALRERDAADAAAAIAALPANAYRGFTLIVADRRRAFAVQSDERAIRAGELAPGHHMVTPDGCDVPSSPRFATHFAAFAAAPPPDPGRGDWAAWESLLRLVDDEDPHRAMTVVTPHDFGTVCSALIAVPREPGVPAQMRFANGPPTRVPYEPVQGAPCVSPA
jgi:uncharacterized protein with NRDE domain